MSTQGQVYKLLYVLITQVYYWRLMQYNGLLEVKTMFSRAGTEGEKLGKMCCSLFLADSMKICQDFYIIL